MKLLTAVFVLHSNDSVHIFLILKLPEREKDDNNNNNNNDLVVIIDLGCCPLLHLLYQKGMRPMVPEPVRMGRVKRSAGHPQKNLLYLRTVCS
jgi:hypothetical protein